MAEFVRKLSPGGGPNSAILIRLLVGGVFLSEGIQKFVYSGDLGIGRFETLGIPWPGFMAPLVALAEIVCGIMLMIGLLTRLASLVMIIEMVVALFATKLPLLLAKGFWIFVHDSSTDFSMLVCSIFLFLVGAGKISVDGMMARGVTSRTRIPGSGGS